jgi:spore coat protein U-like protein
MNFRLTYRLSIYFILVTLWSFSAQGQRITFGTWAGSDIAIQSVDANSLNFGNLIKGGSANSIDISGAKAFEITAPEGYDLTVTIDAPTELTGPNAKTIPYTLAYAYSNRGYTLVTDARLNADVVTTGFTSVTFPVKRKALGLPPPPPAPLDGDSSVALQRITAKAYLFIYGTAGPADATADAGEYTGTINITVEYTP